MFQIVMQYGNLINLYSNWYKIASKSLLSYFFLQITKHFLYSIIINLVFLHRFAPCLSNETSNLSRFSSHGMLQIFLHDIERWRMRLSVYV